MKRNHWIILICWHFIPFQSTKPLPKSDGLSPAFNDWRLMDAHLANRNQSTQMIRLNDVIDTWKILFWTFPTYPNKWIKQLKSNYSGHITQTYIWRVEFKFYIKSAEILENLLLFFFKCHCFYYFAVRVIIIICRSVKLSVYVCQN